MSPRRGQSRSTWPIALLAMLALLVQALVPAAVMAYEARSGQSVVICTAQGARTVILDDTKPAHKGFAGLPCAQCVVASLATTITPNAQISLPVRYAARVEIAPPLARRGLAPVRAPPRPPGQGPPHLQNA
ncbi:DUF2946 family protein [Caulobacter sp. DWP3-1-3b2]|uniref:DUF2946 family protein n=1 Tax=Caulobacter sp. DWP3-1-3b2 TaxID=2804643 RepID=UPI003CEE64F8